MNTFMSSADSVKNVREISKRNFKHWLQIFNCFSVREVDQVQYFDDTTMEWNVKNQRLVVPLFAHGCAVTSLPDGRHGILTVGGFLYENLPAVSLIFILVT